MQMLYITCNIICYVHLCYQISTFSFHNILISETSQFIGTKQAKQSNNSYITHTCIDYTTRFLGSLISEITIQNKKKSIMIQIYKSLTLSKWIKSESRKWKINEQSTKTLIGLSMRMLMVASTLTSSEKPQMKPKIETRTETKRKVALAKEMSLALHSQYCLNENPRTWKDIVIRVRAGLRRAVS